MLDKKRVVITGLGAVTPLGNTRDEFWRRLIAGESGVGPVTAYDVESAGLKRSAIIPASSSPAASAASSRFRIPSPKRAR